MPKPETITIKLKTVTPVWTGGIDRNKMEYIKGSSIMGGLRFWAEAYFRALGNEVCNITSKNPKKKCIYDENKRDICSVCDLFGCTGKSRTFLLKVNVHKLNVMHPHPIKLEIYKSGKKRIVKWYFKPGVMGNFDIKITSLLAERIDPHVLFFLKIMLNWGTIGAQDQYGYGVVGPDSKILDNIKIQDNIFNNLPNKPLSNDYPAFGDFFFFIGKIKNNNAPNTIPFKIRYQVRSDLRKDRICQNQNELRHFFCGSMGSDKTATKYNIALTPDGILRGWGWFPSRGRFDRYRDKCLDLLKNQINKFAVPGTLKWKEFASKRDNVNSAKSWPEFLRELAQGKVVDLIKRK